MQFKHIFDRFPQSLILLLASATLAVASPELADFERRTNESLLWGPYRPNVYFGVRPRIPDGPLTGLMWARVDDYESIQSNFRYTCEQSDSMAGYGWDRYDPRHGGIQTMHDTGNNIDLTTSFVKFPDAGSKGGNWGLRVHGKPQPDAPGPVRTVVLFSIANQAPGLLGMEVEGEEEVLQDPRGLIGDITIKGQHPELGEFKFLVTEGTGAHPKHIHPSYEDRPLDRTFVSSQRVPEEMLWRTKNIAFSEMKQTVDFYLEKYGQENPPPPPQMYTLSNKAGIGNHHLVQKTFDGEFEFDILFSSDSSVDEVSSRSLTRQIRSIVNDFDDKFERVFKPQSPFTGSKYLELSKSLFSNLLGGIGYFYGDWKADRSYAPEYEEGNEGFWEETEEARARAVPQMQPPQELFTAIPSRTFFPRGFLWDEGFHLIPIMDWDIDLALDIVRSWFKLIDDDGWIAREQILGEEARSKVPPEFQVQYPHYANPPTLFLVLADYIDRLESKGDKESLLLNKESAEVYLRDLYPLLVRNYEWFRRTQKGDLKSYDRDAFSTREGYRWRGRTFRHCLPSGLDDYPRPQPPHPGELHVDALSWVGVMAKSLKKISTFLGEKADVEKFTKQEEAIIRNLQDLHWDTNAGVFCDSTINQFEEDEHVCHKGYISLFPFMLGLLRPDDPKIGKLLEAIGNENELWSEHGIRSLSKSDENYGTDENYWRSPIWININYLILEQLLVVAQSKGPHQKRAEKLYSSLRENLVKTVSKSWDETGFAWEQYNPETGAGQRTKHFTGWTSLAAKMIAMPDVIRVRDEL